MADHSEGRQIDGGDSFSFLIGYEGIPIESSAALFAATGEGDAGREEGSAGNHVISVSLPMTYRISMQSP
jgi:hypothetical protein